MRSLKIVEDGNSDIDVISQYQVKKEREWDKRYWQHTCNYCQNSFNQLLIICTYINHQVLTYVCTTVFLVNIHTFSSTKII